VLIAARSVDALDDVEASIEAGLRDYLKTALARYEQPRDIHFITAIPRNPTGKILRRELR